MNTYKAKTCFYCERPMGAASVGGKVLLRTKDHIIPRSKGGHSGKTNILYCCHMCNGAKSNLTPDEFAKWLDRKIDSTIGKRQKGLYSVMLENTRKLIIAIAPYLDNLYLKKTELNKALNSEKRPSTPLWWRGLEK